MPCRTGTLPCTSTGTYHAPARVPYHAPPGYTDHGHVAYLACRTSRARTRVTAVTMAELVLTVTGLPFTVYRGRLTDSY